MDAVRAWGLAHILPSVVWFLSAGPLASALRSEGRLGLFLGLGTR